MRRRWVLLSLLCAAACAKAGPHDAAAPEAAAAPGGDFGMDDGYGGEAEDRAYAGEAPTFDELEARFEQLDADLSAQGIPGSKQAPVDASASADRIRLKVHKKDTDGDQASRCERICSLKDAICDVSQRICGLAESHEDDRKYADACARSQSRCEQATTACSNCTE